MGDGGYVTNQSSGAIDPTPYPNGHQVTAQSLDKNNMPDPQGLRAQFYQSGLFNIMVTQVKVVGRMEPTFGPFMPVEPA
jgi:hypothetical protein